MRFSHRPALYLPVVLLLGALFNFARTQLFAQGSLTPPGPPAPTMKTLDQIRSTGIAISSVNTPGNGSYIYVISTPGSYYLSGNLSGTGSRGGILISSASVTIDLNGYGISASGGAGITDGGTGFSDISIKQGVVNGCSGAGVDLSHCLDTMLSDLTVHSNGGVGIAGGDACAIRDCISRSNVGDNINTGSSSTLKGCTAFGSSSGNGISLGQDSTITGCTANFNKLDGVFTNGASNLSGSCSISQCAAASNAGNGFNAGRNCIFAHCTATKNTLAGFLLGESDEITQSTASYNTGYGIDATDRDSVFNCTASYNSTSGIHLSSGSIVKTCCCLDNTVCGIFEDTGGAFDIEGNTCTENGTGGTTHGAGIRVTLGGGIISHNYCVVNYLGFDLQGNGSLITGNFAGTNTQNYNIGSSSHYGAIVDEAGSGAVVSGSSAASTLGTTDPNANFAR